MQGGSDGDCSYRARISGAKRRGVRVGATLTQRIEPPDGAGACGPARQGDALIDEVGYLMAVLPGDRHLGVETLSKKLGRKLRLATESRLVPVFKACDPGAISPLGPAYGMQTVLDDRPSGPTPCLLRGGAIIRTWFESMASSS